MKNKLIVLKGKKRWVLERILASIFFTVVIYWSFLFFYKIPMAFSESYIKSFSDYLYVIIVCSTLGVYFSYETHHHFNLKLNKYRTYYSIGPFGLGNWEKIDALSYVAVNYLTQKDIFEVNIWDKSNNRFKISYHKNKNEANETGKKLAQDLNLEYFNKNNLNT